LILETIIIQVEEKSKTGAKLKITHLTNTQELRLNRDTVSSIFQSPLDTYIG